MRTVRLFLLLPLAAVHHEIMTSHSTGSGRRGAPPDDEQLLSLLQQVAAGTVAVYRAAIPIRYIRPFSPTYKPESAALAAAGDQSPPLVTYQAGDFFIMSADYAAYYAHLEANSEAVTCLVLGEPAGSHVADARPATELEQVQFLGIRPPSTAARPASPRPGPPPSNLNIF